MKQIIFRLGGKVGFVDEPGGGTSFFVELSSWEGKTDLAYLEQIRADAEASLQGLIQTARHRVESATPKLTVGGGA